MNKIREDRKISGLTGVKRQQAQGMLHRKMRRQIQTTERIRNKRKMNM